LGRVPRRNSGEQFLPAFQRELPVLTWVAQRSIGNGALPPSWLSPNFCLHQPQIGLSIVANAYPPRRFIEPMSGASKRKPNIDPDETLTDSRVLKDLVSRIGEGIYITNEAGEILDANPAMLQILGLKSVEDLKSVGITDFISAEQRDQETEILRRDGEVSDFELTIRRKDGQTRYVLDTAYSVKRDGVTVYRGIVRDITERKHLESQLRDQTLRDPLTGAFNRRHLATFEERWREKSWGCIVFDIDHFKHYNDTRGHQAGDEVLIALSHFLSRQIRADASLVRMGGDEFLVLLPNASATDVEAAHLRIQHAALKQAPIPFSMGYAAREGDERLNDTIHRADANLYQVRTIARAPNEERRRIH
jgi:diguanylate cyclase (GGDEF)-like protein/PAS domain S-box-containing protein